jgi:hypothetical protein
MFDWIADNSEALSTIINGILMVVWAVYLNLFLRSLQRTKRPIIMISRSAGTGPEARLFISNMGAEPIYVTALIADVECGEAQFSATITDNDEIQSDELSSPREATSEGPLGSGDYMDAGSFGGLMERISKHAVERIDPGKVDRVTLTVVAAAGHSNALSAGTKSYRILRRDTGTVFHPEHLSTRQLRNSLARRRIRRRLNRDLQAELG